MIRHIVAWRLASQDPAERTAQAQKMSDDLGALRGVVPSLLEITVGPDVLGGGNWDVALIADFAHQAVVGFVRSVVADRVCVDLEV